MLRPAFCKLFSSEDLRQRSSTAPCSFSQAPQVFLSVLLSPRSHPDFYRNVRAAVRILFHTGGCSGHNCDPHCWFSIILIFFSLFSVDVSYCFFLLTGVQRSAGFHFPVPCFPSAVHRRSDVAVPRCLSPRPDIAFYGLSGDGSDISVRILPDPTFPPSGALHRQGRKVSGCVLDQRPLHGFFMGILRNIDRLHISGIKARIIHTRR